MKNKTTAAVLALIFGGIGVHRFYLGHIGLGFIYLIFSFTFIPIFISLIDFIVLLAYSENKFNEKYNKKSVNQSYGRSYSISKAGELEKYFTLMKRGAITQEEFDQAKRFLTKG